MSAPFTLRPPLSFKPRPHHFFPGELSDFLLILFLPTSDPSSPPICQNVNSVLSTLLFSHSTCFLHWWIFVPISSTITAAAAASKSLQLCPTLCDTAHQAPRAWDSPGKNTGVGCHFLLQCMKVKSQSEVAQSCPTLSDPMDWSLPGSSIHGIFQARVLESGAIACSQKHHKRRRRKWGLSFWEDAESDPRKANSGPCPGVTPVFL